MMKFMVIQVIGLLLIFVIPQIALSLPTLIYGEKIRHGRDLSETR